VEEARRDPGRAADALARAALDARHAIDDLRSLVNGVHPLVLTDRGIAVALEELTAGAPMVVELDVTGERFAPEIEAAAYFTVAEALTNVAKHAEATVAEVRVARDGDALVLEVADDGRGGARLNPGLRDRLAVLNGTLKLVPASQGTRLRGVIPL
jgi:signal transduction histidine kinase